MFGLFKRRADARPIVVVHLNARLQPMHRGDVFEDPLDQWLRQTGLGEVCGAGTAFVPGEGVQSCDIEVRVNAIDEDTLVQLAQRLDALGAPIGSKLVMQDSGHEMAIGASEGLALHLNGTDLADEVYAATSADELIGLMNAALGSRGKLMSHFDGATETSLFLYGPSYAEMEAAISPVLAHYPLCQRARLEKIA